MDAAAELVQIVDGNNHETCVVPRKQMRDQRLIHRCTYVFVFNARRELFVQQRTLHKDIYPGYLDLAAGGVMLAGETYDDGASRELQEELGIGGVELQSYGVRYFEDPLSRVFGGIYSCVWDGPMTFQAEEVAGGEFRALPEVFALERNGAKVTPDSLAALRHLLAAKGEARSESNPGPVSSPES